MLKFWNYLITSWTKTMVCLGGLIYTVFCITIFVSTQGSACIDGKEMLTEISFDVQFQMLRDRFCLMPLHENVGVRPCMTFIWTFMYT